MGWLARQVWSGGRLGEAGRAYDLRTRVPQCGTDRPGRTAGRPVTRNPVMEPRRRFL